jgi:hypothetical protein
MLVRKDSAEASPEKPDEVRSASPGATVLQQDHSSVLPARVRSAPPGHSVREGAPDKHRQTAILRPGPDVGPRDRVGTVKKHRIFAMSFASVYPLYIAKAEKKGRTKAEVDQIIRWLTGYSPKKFETLIEKRVDIETFITKAPKLNPSRSLIKGVVCGIRVEDIEDPLMREVRYLDKLIDELAKGKAMEKILRK